MDSTTFQCAPALGRRNGDTCLPEKTIHDLVRAWNGKFPRNKIDTGRGVTRRNNGRGGDGTRGGADELYRKLRTAMKSVYKCDTEYCLVKKLPMAETSRKSMLTYFRPEKPKAWDNKPTLWLDSFNIEDVMNQYEQAHPEFEFLGPVPIDFDTKAGAFGRCVVDELCKLNLADMEKKGKRKIGIIFNLDPHDEPGSHWVCGFVDLDASAAYYFDSYGFKPEKEINVLLSRLHAQGIKNIYYNDIRHQKKGSECGMYCLFTIICLLNGRSFYDICTHVVDDDTMNGFRDLLYAEEKPRRESIEKGLKLLCGAKSAGAPHA
jgi:hypothetical protein